MRRAAVRLVAAAALSAAAAGCGATTVVTTTATVTVTAPAATAPGPTAGGAAHEACVELEANIRIVSQLIAASAQEVEHSLHPKQLAKRTGDTRRNLLLAVHALRAIALPAELAPARSELVSGLLDFAADFGRAERSVRRGSIARAAQQLVDRPALAKVTAATQTIQRACGG